MDIPLDINMGFYTENLDDYECQFTVMNYSNFPMTQLDYKSFIHNIEKQHNIQWDPIQEGIHGAIKGRWLILWVWMFMGY